MSKPKFLLWTEENAKDASDDALFLYVDEVKDEKYYEISMHLVDRNRKKIKRSNILIIKEAPKGILSIIKCSNVNPVLPIPTDARQEILIHSETEAQQFELHQKHILMDQLMHSLKQNIKEDASSPENNEVKH